MDELDQLIPPDCVLDFGALKVSVRPLVIRQIAPLAKVLQKIPAVLIEDFTAGRFDVLAIAQHTDTLIEACAIATDGDIKSIGNITPDQLMALLGTIFEVNADFFLQRLAPTTEKLGAIAVRLISRIGPTASSASSPPATADPTS